MSDHKSPHPGDDERVEPDGHEGSVRRNAGESGRPSREAPDGHHLLIALAGIERRLGRPGRAARYFEKVLTSRPDSVEAWSGYAGVLLDLKRHADATGALKRAIELEPDSAGLHRQLGVALTQCGRDLEAVDTYRCALALEPESPEVLNNIGSILHNRGTLEEAADHFERAIGMKPRYLTAMNNLGVVRLKLGQPGEAATVLREALALDPDAPATLYLLGLALSQQDALEESEKCFNQVLLLRPDFPEAFHHLGIVLAREGKQPEAVGAYRRALALKPDYPEVLSNLGAILQSRGKWAKARACFERAIRIRPEFTEALNNLGLWLYQRGILDEAAEIFRRAISVDPRKPEAYNNLGIVLDLQGALEESISSYRKALALRPDFPEALNNLGRALRDSGRMEEAISVLERAIALKSDLRPLHLSLATFLLAMGRFEEGWREYQWRPIESHWRCEDPEAAGRVLAQPLWRGEAGENSVLLLHAEQGYGDTIQFCRYAPLAAVRGVRVLLAVQPPLVRLLGSVKGVEKVVGMDQRPPDFDFQCPLMSLPLIFGTRLENIPAEIPYVNSEEDLVLAWRERFPAATSGPLKVGLVWAGNTWQDVPLLAAYDRRRSILPEMLAPLMNVPRVRFYSLQKDGPSAPAEFGLVDLMGECRDFADTAALIANLDLVITVDTAVAHLAGALGKPVWVLNRFDSCWRWLRDRDDSPWYPTLRLFRQPRPGDWTDVIARARDELVQCCGMS